MTGAGAPGGPGIIKALKKAGFSLYTGDCNSLASGRFLHDQFIQLPKADEDEFIPFVLNFCITHNVNVVFPLVTKELFKFSSAKKVFAENNIAVIVSNFESLSIANDKGRLYQHLQGSGIPVPFFEIITTTDELINAARRLGYPQVAVVVKPTLSNGSRGVRILQEDIDQYELLFQQKPNHLYSRLETICGVLGSRTFPPLIVSEYLPGIEFTVDALVQEGIPSLMLPRSRTKMNNGISVQGTFIRDEKIIHYCDQILRSLSLDGPIGLQVKQDREGVFKILEINPRIQGTSVAALGMGVNLPALSVQQLFEPVTIDPDALPWGTSFVRYYEEVFYK